MKKILFVGAVTLLAGGQALAADLPPAAPAPRAPATYVPAPAPIFSWTGIYVGLNGGYNWGGYYPTGFASTALKGFLVGGTVGGNYQIGQFVIGVEGDGDYDSINNTTPYGATFKSNWLATVRGRAGFAWDRVLFYGTGGGAFAPANHTGITGVNSTTTMIGWTGGGGVEYAFTPNVTFKAEYLFVGFPSSSLNLIPLTGPPAVSTSIKVQENVFRVGLNYKFW
jgi:outer membrane immunogenic protein